MLLMFGIVLFTAGLTLFWAELIYSLAAGWR